MTVDEVRQAVYELAEDVPDSRLTRIDVLWEQLAYELDAGA